MIIGVGGHAGEGDREAEKSKREGTFHGGCLSGHGKKGDNADALAIDAVNRGAGRRRDIEADGVKSFNQNIIISRSS